MRVIEPHHLKVKKKRRAVRRSVFGVIGAVLALAILLNFAASKHIFSRSKPTNNVGSVKDGIAPAAVNKSNTPKTFTGNEFKELYRSVMVAYPNTEPFIAPPEITGNEKADERIRKIAEDRGFQQTRIPVTALVRVDEPLLRGNGDDLLQPQAAAAWQEIKAAAKLEDIPLTIISAFRSPEWQRDLFMQRLLARGVTVQQIAAGNADAAVEANLTVTAVPGYSRHHTGYTVDFWCDDGTGLFANSKCFQWLHANNYENAKKYGWIPSYPEGADEQGPEPEPWEYVWVGKTVLY